MAHAFTEGPDRVRRSAMPEDGPSLCDFRSYSTADSNIVETYRLNHQFQTVSHVKQMLQIHCERFDKCKRSIWDIIQLQDQIIDESDPDLNQRQILHAFQTAEFVRKLYPDQDYLHLVGLLHDCGKVLLLEPFGSLPQWNVVGDTFPVGTEFSDRIVYADFFESNPDKPVGLGIYEANCGLDNVFLVSLMISMRMWSSSTTERLCLNPR